MVLLSFVGNAVYHVDTTVLLISETGDFVWVRISGLHVAGQFLPVSFLSGLLYLSLMEN